jgi:serine phosphatase RsbU (regulator of sigma subunit)
MSKTTAPPTEPKLIATLRQDLRDVHTSLKTHGFRPLGRSFSELEEFYLSSTRKQQLAAMNPVKRWFVMAWWLLKSLFFKLTPARRVMLVAGLVLVVSSGQTTFGSTNVQVSFNVPLAGVTLILLVLMLELKDKLLARDELEAGRAVQRALMPDQSPAIPGWNVFLYTRSANDVGGDLVDVLRLDAARYAISVADLAGKGLPAALLMAKLQATIRALAPDAVSLPDLARRVNRTLHRDGIPGSFATMVYVELTAESPRIRLVTAGHMPPLVLRGRTFEELPRGALALGVMADVTYAQQDVDLAPGDTLLVYTDGVTEAMDRNGDFFGDERLRALLPSLAGLDAAGIAGRILEAVDAFVDDAPPHDDVSLAVVRRTA